MESKWVIIAYDLSCDDPEHVGCMGQTHVYGPFDCEDAALEWAESREELQNLWIQCQIEPLPN